MKFAIFSSMLLIILMPCSSLLGMIIPSGFATSIVAPTTITQPGTYRLSFDIAGPIVIAADNVVIDLNNNSISATTPISANGRDDIQIFNGTIENATTGIDLTSCSNVKLSDINFNNNATAVSIMTSTGVFVDEASFQGHSGTVITVQDSADSFVRHCAFSNNDTTIISVDNSTSCFFENLAIVDNASSVMETLIDITNSRSFIFKHIEMFSNTSTNGLNCFSFTNCNAMTCKKCIIADNNAGSAIFHGFFITSGSNLVFDSIEINNNRGSGLFGYRSMDNARDIIVLKGTINQNVTGSQLIEGIRATDTQKFIVNGTDISDNQANFLFKGISSINSTDCCFINCSIKENRRVSGTNTFVIDIDATSTRIFVFNNLIESNGVSSTPVRNLGIDCAVLSNISQNNSSTYSGVSANIITNYVPATGLFDGGTPPTTRKLVNIEA